MITVAIALLLGLASAQHAPSGHTERMGQNMTQSMTMPVGSELEFVRGMVAHHQEAVNSARVVSGNSKRPELRRFAKVLVEVQEREIETLRGWLGAWYPDAPERALYTPMMRALPDAAPDEADRAFVEDMVAHHEMAVAMSERFLAADFEKHLEAEALAREIIVTQTAEVDTLRGWLRAWYGAAPPAAGSHDGH